MKKIVFAVLAVALILVGFYAFRYSTAGPSLRAIIDGSRSVAPIESPLAYMPPQYPQAPALKSPRTPPQGSKEYRSVFYRFQFFYPDDLTIKEYKGKDSSITLTFQSSDGRSFQVFIIPYGDAKISEERFKLDIPSGVMKEPTEITVDGAHASHFYSTDASMGETVEVWLVSHGFLYEITTYKELDPLLSPIISSWQFL